MATKEFTITLFQENMRDIESVSHFMLPDRRDVLYFYFEREPNIEAGDVFNVRILVDDTSVIKYQAVALDVCPPLMQPRGYEEVTGNEEELAGLRKTLLDAHMTVMEKYVIPEVTEKVKEEYLAGKANKGTWALYFRQLKQ